MQENSRKANGGEFIMKIYIVYYSSWDTMELYYVGLNKSDAYDHLEDNVRIYGVTTTYLQVWENGVMISDRNAKEVLKNEQLG